MKGFIAVLLLVAAVAAENQCPAEQEENWNIELLLRHEDCEKFYKCTFGQPVEQSCPAGLHFNLENWECDWPENVDCTGRNDPLNPTPEPTTAEPEPTTTTTAKPETTTKEPTTVEPETTTTTTAKPETTTAEPETTTTTTAKPDTTTAVPTTAELETTTTTTAKPEPETTAQPTTAAPESEEDGENAGNSEESEIEFLENGCPVDPHIHWLLPNEEDCNAFYYCVWGELVPRECPSTLHFNRELQVCDWPADAGCVVSANKHYGARAQLFHK